MLRKLLSIGALVVVALTLGANSAFAKDKQPSPGKSGVTHQYGGDGFSDGRL